MTCNKGRNLPHASQNAKRITGNSKLTPILNPYTSPAREDSSKHEPKAGANSPITNKPMVETPTNQEHGDNKRLSRKKS
ncbi:hypothetical protein O181_024330 [Austropuccinia psidii MF-1]|uniref:Uncharacterized protein n=1 Tax=Austropuccinia psidii MF-1 TaxID=1389203 RepID=A0A9Q3H008_9BASI|nr:hypothetical protein [Austropuccinia psidii MF-1]